MALPLFYHSGSLPENTELELEEDTGRHIVQVLRMQTGEGLLLTDGKGTLATTSISKAEKKKCRVRIEKLEKQADREFKLHLAVAFTKNSSRNEWILEKATELGVSSIIPLISSRSEKEKFRFDRWQNILIAALIQSQQYYLPQLYNATSLKEILKIFNSTEQKLIGHCIDTETRLPLPEAMNKNKNTIMLIGPEGDFTNEEVKNFLGQGYTGVTMGRQRLRTETAAIAACAYFNLVNAE
jgi:16S rRNA (uracil1498-N3)-methyltransferase